MKLEDVLKFALVIGLAGAGFVYMAESCQRRRQLEELRVQNERLGELVEVLRECVEGGGCRGEG